MAYAEGTAVSVEKSQADIAGLLMKFGATGYQYGWDDGRAAVMFRVLAEEKQRVVRFVVPLPDKSDKAFRVTASGRSRANPDAAYDAELKRRWRALFMVIKAKLVAVETEVTSFEEEFLAHIVVPGTGLTVYEQMQERLAEAYRTGDPIDIIPSLPKVRPTARPIAIGS